MSRQNDKLYTASQVRQLDQAAIGEHGIPGYELMCRAGQAVFDAARQGFPGAGRWWVLCGGGNNAGDGYVVARLALEAGLEARVVALKPPSELDGDALAAARAWEAAGGILEDWPVLADPGADLVIDALLGTGLDRDVEGTWREAIDWAGRLDCPRIAVDIPSGLHADSGRVMGCCLAADMTVSFIGQKRGLYTADGPDHAGEIIFDDLGTPDEIHAGVGPAGRLLDQRLLYEHLGPRRANSHKGSYGHVLVVGGNAGMGGAVRMAGEAALRTGAGLVTVATHPVHAHWLNLPRPELMVHAVASGDDLAPVLGRASVLALGPGLGTDTWARGLWTALLKHDLPMVLDADGLNLLAKHGGSPTQAILTPHPAEAARLLDLETHQVQADRVGSALDLASRHAAVVVLKGCGTVIARPEGDWAICGLGNPGMATAGSGDVLTGVIAAFLAQGHDAWAAARLGVVAHAAAGDMAAASGQRGMLAGDITAWLPDVLNG